MASKPTPEELKAKQEEIQKRTEAFNGDLIPLLGEHKLGLGAHPVLVPIPGHPHLFALAAAPHTFDDTPREKKEDKGTNVESPAETPPEAPASDLVEG